jgi:hypothetical protein
MGWGREKRNRRPGAGQRAKPATRVRRLGFGNERAKPKVFPLNKLMEAISLPHPRSGKQRHPCNGATQTDALRAGLWASGRPARREARVPAGQCKKSRALSSAKRGIVRVRNPSRSFESAPDRYRSRPRLQARFAAQIEQVTRRAAQTRTGTC